MLEQVLEGREVRFRGHEEVGSQLMDLCAASSGVRSVSILGRSEQGRELLGFVIGDGPRRVSLLAGNHSDEPVGPETLRLLVEVLAGAQEWSTPLLKDFTFVVVPHTNPDGEALNRTWIERWPDAHAYLEHAFRELPGRDMEFSFPDGRVESRAVADFLSKHGPYDLHCSLHGMGFSDGAFLLIDRRWGFRTERLQGRFREIATEEGLALHDHNRQGEKGFFYLGPGFNTTPEGEAMKVFFRARGDDEMASRFRMSSMDFVRSLGGDPLCLVTEMPLFLISGDLSSEQGRPGPYLAWLDRVRDMRASRDAEQRQSLLRQFHVRPLDLETAMRIQLGVIEAGLDTVR